MKILNSTLIIVLLLLQTISINAITKNIQILYTHNTNGQFKSCRCMYGGYDGFISNRATLFRKYKNLYPNTILIDGGDTFEFMGSDNHNTFLALAMAYLSYDIISLGESDVGTNLQYLLKLFSKNPAAPRIVNSNLLFTRAKSKILQKHSGALKMAKAGLSINIEAYLDPDLLKFSTYIETKRNDNWLKSYKRKKGFNILLVHSEWEKLKLLLSKITKSNLPDLILLSHYPVWNGETNKKILNIPVFYLGKDAGRIGQIIISPAGKIISKKIIKVLPSGKRDLFIKQMEEKLEIK